MSSMFAMRFLRFTSLVFLLAGCAAYRAGPTLHTDPYAQSGIDDLLAFGASMANMTDASRAELCKSLTNTQKISYSAGVELHLMVGRLLSDACGDIPSILDRVHSISANYASDDRLQRLIAIHTLALTRMQNQSKKLVAIEQKQKKVKSVLESRDSREPVKNETRLLREKLEAIRSMEKQMDESTDGN